MTPKRTIPIPKSISPSSISQFQSCPLAFRFAYIERLPQAPSPAASKGTLVHRALEHLMTRDAAERTVEAALADLVLARAELAEDPDFTGLELTDELPQTATGKVLRRQVRDDLLAKYASN